MKNAAMASPTVAGAIAEAIEGGEPFFSFEYFPPKTDKGLANLKARFHRMKEFGPRWMDITWGAGGTTSDRSLEIATYIQNEVGLPALMHLTCTNMDPSTIDLALKTCRENGVNNLLLLRGDPPKGEERWTAKDRNFTCALDLIRYVREKTGEFFNITCAGYPEGHPDVRKPLPSDADPAEYWAVDKTEKGAVGVSEADLQKEIGYLKSKQDAGASVIITQLFFEPKIFLAWVDKCRAAGITIPIIPGIMTLHKAASFKRMTAFCKTIIPDALAQKVAEFSDNPPEFRKFGVQYLKSMCEEVLAAGVPGIHVYCLNDEKVSGALVSALGLAK